jgi:hypothetical protein
VVRATQGSRAILSDQSGDLRDFISDRVHPALFSHYRARFILSRVRMMATVFAVLTPFWIGIDLITCSLCVALSLADARMMARNLW